MKPKTKKISFRVDENLYNFLKKFCSENNIDNVSTLIRNVIIYFHLAYITGNIQKDIHQLRNDANKIIIDVDVKKILGIER